MKHIKATPHVHIGDIYGSAKVWPVYRRADGRVLVPGDDNNEDDVYACLEDLKYSLAQSYTFIEVKK